MVKGGHPAAESLERGLASLPTAMDSSDSTGFSARVTWPAPGVAVVRLAGELDLFVAPDLRAALQPPTEKASVICVDLQEVPFLDTTAFAVLLGTRKALMRRRGALLLAGAVPVVAQSLDRAGLGELLRRFDTVDDALRGAGDVRA